jgi:hypothetical protein
MSWLGNRNDADATADAMDSSPVFRAMMARANKVAQPPPPPEPTGKPKNKPQPRASGSPKPSTPTSPMPNLVPVGVMDYMPLVISGVILLGTYVFTQSRPIGVRAPPPMPTKAFDINGIVAGM